MLARKSRQNRSSAVAAKKNELTEADCMLITYGDQVRATGEPPLATLTNFLSKRVARTISAVHILAFLPQFVGRRIFRNGLLFDRSSFGDVG